MIYLHAFIFSGIVCLIGQVILDNTKLTPGHLTSLLVLVGAILEISSVYDKFIIYAGAGASVPITSFGHSLTHAALLRAKSEGIMGLFMGMFDLTCPGITAAIVFSFFLSLFFKPKS